MIQQVTTELDRQQDAIIAQQKSLERRMDRREAFDTTADHRLDALERFNERNRQ